ncbi:helix-turn-helix domain-containing protein [Kitasatospora purpeofusca]|uniref:helix-turn-helix domain-containing protein n=1 Tax=Kitasatospora purpeofusca TaxID=67352 RepID=UPI0036D2FDB9
MADRKRPGRPRRFTALQAAQVRAPACQLPADTGAPLSRWSCPEPAREAVARRITAFVSASTVRRWPAEDALKPSQHRSWIFIAARRQGQGRAGAGPVCTHLGRRPTRLGRVRHQLAPGRARAPRVNHTYGRGGALAHLAAYDVHSAKVFGRTEPRTADGTE